MESTTNKGTTPTNTNEHWLDGQDVMQMLHISARTLQTWRTEKTIGFSKVGRKIFYKASEIYKMLEACYTPANKEGGEYGL